MRLSSPHAPAVLPSEYLLPLSILGPYLFFLLRRPISASNAHYLARRIHGLQSLAALFDSTGFSGIDAIGQKLAALQPANFARLARDLQFRLALLQQVPTIPPDYLVTHRPPARPLLDGVDRILLVLGPAIGIGDEIILFPLPSWLRQARPDAAVTVMSGYPGLWERVAGIQRREYYSTHRELVNALRGARDRFDAVVFADFEKPGLVTAMCQEQEFPLYIELSLGGQYAAVVDTRQKRVHAVGLPLEARLNYYETLEWLLEWLGLDVRGVDRYESIVRHVPTRSAAVYRVFVSPFTSKHEPSLVYWSDLLSLVSRCGIGELEFWVDAGVSLSTERFATALIRSTVARAPHGRRFVLAADPDDRTLSLPGVFGRLEQCDVVLCADSFAAHAGPLFGCATVVMARAGLENWRTPFARSFYFDIEQPMREVATAIARLFEALSGATPMMVPLPSAARLHDATVGLSGQLAAVATDDSALADPYRRFIAAYDAAVNELDHWPGDLNGLLRDVNYRRAWPPLDPDSPAADALAQMQTAVSRWDHTNLRKILALVVGAD